MVIISGFLWNNIKLIDGDLYVKLLIIILELWFFVDD